MPTRTAIKRTSSSPFDLQYLLGEWREMFSRKTVLSDCLAGLTVAMVALPLNLALAVAAGVEPSIGIVSGIVAGIVTALFGGQRYAVSGPAAAMAVVLIEIAHRYGMPGIWFVAIVAGLLQIITGFLRLGRVISYLPLPVIVGFSNAIGILLIFNSLDFLLGVTSRPLAHPTVGGHAALTHPFVPEFFKDVFGLFDAVFVKNLVNPYTLGVGLATIIVAVVAQRISKKVPGILIAVVLTPIVAHLAHIPVQCIFNVAPIPSLNLIPHTVVLPAGIDNWEELQALMIYSLTVFFLGSIESLLSASVADGMTMSKKHRPDQELIGQGLANVIVPFFSGIPVTGVITRTAVNINAGAKTRLAAIVQSIALCVLVFTVAPLVEKIPLATLAGILVLTGCRIVEWDYTRQIFKGSKTEGWVLVATMVASVSVDLTAGVLTGLLLTCVLFVRQMSRVALISEESDGEDLVGIPSCNYVRTYLVDGPLFFGAAQKFAENIVLAQDLKVVILNMRAVSAIDLTGVDALITIKSQLRRNGIRLVIAELGGQALELLKNSKGLDAIGSNNYFADYQDALLDVNEKLLTSVCVGCSAGLGGLGGSSLEAAAAKANAPRDCKLRTALMMDNSRIAKTIKSRMDKSQRTKTGQFDAIGSDLSRLHKVASEDDIPTYLRDTPIATMIKCQNLGQIDNAPPDAPQMVIGMCIDYRKSLHLPQNCAYVIRRTGANMAGSEFSVALALSTGIEYMALVAHNHCVMSNPQEKREAFVASLRDRHGWTHEQALSFFDQHAQSREIDDAIDFSIKEARRLSTLFRGLKVVPLLFMLEDNCLYLVKEWLAADEQVVRELQKVD
ncbi:MAG: SulP family inorganic anion transporter [Cyanobacteria bacterium SZAS TMP-1]|nr:SulP family inorganic anion transporter [Cyanobacteria bacterium SZAS TMP-1]